MRVPPHENAATLAVSIIIPSRFRADLLENCLRSVVAHMTVEAEIIVVDDGSSEGCVSRVAGRFPGVRVVRNEAPTGFAKAVQRGIDLATAPVIHLLNDDTRVESGWLDRPLECLRDPRIGAVTPLVLQDDGRVPPRIDSAGDGYALSGRAFKRMQGSEVPRRRLSGCWVFGASGSSAFYRREALRVVGGFPVEFGAYFEDVEVSWRLQRAGWRVWFAPESVVWHKVTASYKPLMKPEFQEIMVRNQELVFVNHGLFQYKAIALIIHLLLLVVRGVKALARGRLDAFVRGLARAWMSPAAANSNRGLVKMIAGNKVPLELF